MRSVLVGMVFFLACHPSTDAGDGDAGDLGDANDHGDGGTHGSTPSCDVAKPFGAPEPISELNTSLDEMFGSLSPDERTVYFSRGASYSPEPWQILVATRADRTSSFGEATPITELMEQGGLFPAVTRDGLTMYLVGKGILVTHRNRTTDAFSPATRVLDYSATRGSPQSLFVMEDGTLFFTSFVATSYTGPGSHPSEDVYYASCGSSDCSSPELVLPGRGGSVLTADALTIFSGTVPSTTLNGATLADIVVATRSDPSSGFGTPTIVSELRTGESELPGWLSWDGCALYFNRTASQGKNFELYVARRP